MVQQSQRNFIETIESILYGYIDKSVGKNEQAIINAGWNLGCHLLKNGHMGEGWELYNYGLQTPAPGLQRWQRALPKLFDYGAVELWDGSHINNRRLLVMGEQAIGDTMMFLRLLPVLLKESKNITLMLPSRLVPIYKRSYPELNVVSDEIGEEKLDSNLFDLQIPCGSIPSRRMKEWISDDWEQTTLKADEKLVQSLSQKYRVSMTVDQPLIGVSWIGGGKSERIRTKSMPSEQFQEIMKQIPNARFLSLQYGKCHKQIEAWQHNGFDIVFDHEIDPLKNMDDWLAQVACCNSIISVANTTIHGAGGLNKPTLCLQSRTTDWRWIDGLPHSYWYSSVDAVSQAKDGSWDQSIKGVKKWLESKPNNGDEMFKQHNTKQKQCLDAMTFSTPSA